MPGLVGAREVIERVVGVLSSRVDAAVPVEFLNLRKSPERIFALLAAASAFIRKGIVRLNSGGCNQTVPAAYFTDAHLRLSLSSSSLPRRDYQSLRLVIFSLRPELPRCRRNVSDARCLPQL